MYLMSKGLFEPFRLAVDAEGVERRAGHAVPDAQTHVARLDRREAHDPLVAHARAVGGSGDASVSSLIAGESAGAAKSRCLKCMVPSFRGGREIRTIRQKRRLRFARILPPRKLANLSEK